MRPQRFVQNEILDALIAHVVRSAQSTAAASMRLTSPLPVHDTIVSCERLQTLELQATSERAAMCVDPQLRFVTVHEPTDHKATSDTQAIVLLKDRVTDQKLQVLWDGMTIDAGATNTTVRLGDIRRIASQNAYLSLLVATSALDSPLWRESDDVAVGYEQLREALGLGDTSMSEDSDMALLLPLSYLRKHFRVLSQRPLASTRAGFSSVRVDSLMAMVYQELRDDPPRLTDGPRESDEELQNILTICRAIHERLKRSGVDEISWPELEYLVRYRSDLSTPEVFSRSMETDLLASGPTVANVSATGDASKRAAVAQVLTGSESGLVFVLFADGWLDMWASDEDQEPTVRSRTTVRCLCLHDGMTDVWTLVVCRQGVCVLAVAVAAAAVILRQLVR